MARPVGRNNYTTKELQALGVPEWLVVIRKLRKKYGISQEELAAMLQMNVRTVQRLELGQHKPRPNIEAKLKDFAQRWSGKCDA